MLVFHVKSKTTNSTLIFYVYIFMEQLSIVCFFNHERPGQPSPQIGIEILAKFKNIICMLSVLDNVGLVPFLFINFKSKLQEIENDIMKLKTINFSRPTSLNGMGPTN